MRYGWAGVWCVLAVGKKFILRGKSCQRNPVSFLLVKERHREAAWRKRQRKDKWTNHSESWCLMTPHTDCSLFNLFNCVQINSTACHTYPYTNALSHNLAGVKEINDYEVEMNTLVCRQWSFFLFVFFYQPDVGLAAWFSCLFIVLA